MKTLRYFLAVLVMLLGLVSSVSAEEIASNPYPADGAASVEPDVYILWSPAFAALFHDVYLGTDFAAVNNATIMSPEFKGRQASTTYNPGGLALDTTYYWRIDEVNGINIWKGDVWSLATIGIKASNPNPADGAKCVEFVDFLSWSSGYHAALHAVYFGTDFAAVNNATADDKTGIFRRHQLANTYPRSDFGALQACTTYYWRIDEVQFDGTIYKGDVWSFTIKGEECCRCIEPPEGMVAWWPLDENEPAGGISEDIAGNNDGTWVGNPTPELGEHVKNSLRFNGSNNFVRVTPINGALDFGTRNFSIDCWVKPRITTGNKVVVDKRGGGMFDPIGYALYLANGQLSFQLGDGIGVNGWTDYLSSLTVEINKWNHVAVTVDRGNPNGLMFYVNGVSQTSNPTGRQGSLDNNANLLIGYDRFVSDNHFNGSIDEVELFNRALGADEVRAIFMAGSEGKCKCTPAPAYKDDIKWSQPPDRNYLGCINGWDEASILDTNCWDCRTQCHGDADCDGTVGRADASILAAAYGTSYGEPNYNPCADFDRDGNVDASDFTIMNSWWDRDPPTNCPSARAIVADDWVCMDDRPIKDIHWWGSFKGWTGYVPPNDKPNAFRLGIWTDVPDPDPNDPNNFSHPGRLIWEKVCSCYTWSYAGCDIDPRGVERDESGFMFDQLLSQDEWFYQDPNGRAGTVYWLSIAAIYEDGSEPNHPWGWKTRPHFYNDDAVRITDVNDSLWPPVIGSIWENGESIEYPAGTSWDMAFVLTSNREYSPRRWYWPPDPLPLPDDPPLPTPNIPVAMVDIYEDGEINFKDVAVLSDYWLERATFWP